MSESNFCGLDNRLRIDYSSPGILEFRRQIHDASFHFRLVDAFS